jgi:DNA-binding response OmpR family regulator/HPt (histidine-containing phosphotransfer) domain-containing protein
MGFDGDSCRYNQPTAHPMQRILIVDDDHVQVDVVSFLLRREGLEPVAAYDGASAVRLFAEQPPDLVILDVNLGDVDGRELLRQFRKKRPELFILMLTALNAEEDRVLGLELGADDYLAKPFGHRELVARVHALLRRASGDTSQANVSRRMQLGSLVLDPSTHEAARNGRRLDLSPTEFRLLQTLLQHPNEMVPTRTLLKSVWGHQDMTARNVLRVTASRLRSKLQVDPSSPQMLQTVAGEGLMISSDETPLAAPGPAEPAVDMEVVSELREIMTGVGGQSLQQLNDVFVSLADKHMRSMHDAYSKADGATLANDAHRLRGTSATMGARRVRAVCAMIEDRSRAGDLDPVDGLLVQLENEMAQYEAAIAPLLE